MIKNVNFRKTDSAPSLRLSNHNQKFCYINAAFASIWSMGIMDYIENIIYNDYYNKSNYQKPNYQKLIRITHRIL